MSLFNNSSRQLRRITEQSISMLKVSQTGNTIQHLSFFPSKAKTYHGRHEKYTSILTFRMEHSSLVFILKEPNCSSSPRQKYFSLAKKRIHFTVNTKSKNTKTIMCSSWSKRHSSPSNLLFLENFNFLVDQPKLNHS